jgi:DNA polymerase III alpha subunit (gram-positive type)
LNSDLYGSELLRYSNQKYIVFDSETESLNLHSVRAWDLAWSLCQGNSVLERYQYFLKWPDLKVSKGAARVTRFDPKKIEELGVDPKIAVEHLCSFLYNKELYNVVHNGLSYDLYVINNCRRCLGQKPDYSFAQRMYDSNAIARAIHMKIPFDRNKYSLLEFQYRFANSPRKDVKTNLTILGKKYKCEFNESELHGAEKDVALNFAIWRKQIWEIEI